MWLLERAWSVLSFAWSLGRSSVERTGRSRVDLDFLLSASGPGPHSTLRSRAELDLLEIEEIEEIEEIACACAARCWLMISLSSRSSGAQSTCMLATRSPHAVARRSAVRDVRSARLVRVRGTVRGTG